MRLAFFVGFLCQASPRTILTRSRHLPVGVTEGSRKRNLNKSGVRLWTGCPFVKSSAASTSGTMFPDRWWVRSSPYVQSQYRPRLQNVSMTVVESRGVQRNRVDNEEWVTCRKSNSCRQKSRAITNLEKPNQRVRLPSGPPTSSTVFNH